MKTNKFLAVGLMATMILSSCSNSEDPALGAGTTANAIELTAGIGAQTRAVIKPGYENDLPVAFARLDPAGTGTGTGSLWNLPELKAVRVGGSGATAIVFETTQEYPASNGITSLFGYYPRPASTPVTSTANKAVADYSITGDEDIMATDYLTGAANNPFTTCTFKHLLAQVQIRLVASDDAKALWGNGDGTGVTVSVQGVPRALQLTLTKSGSTGSAVLSVHGTPDTGDLPVHGLPEVTNPDDLSPVLGYCMLFPTPNLGSGSTPLTLQVTANYNTNSVTKTVSITNIAGGLQAGVSNIVTLILTKTGEISATAKAEIADWNPGANGSGVVTP